MSQRAQFFVETVQEPLSRDFSLKQPNAILSNRLQFKQLFSQVLANYARAVSRQHLLQFLTIRIFIPRMRYSNL